MQLYKLFFHLLDTDPPTPWGPNEKVITDVEKRERKIRDFFTKRNMRTVLECLFVCWPGWKLRNIYRWNMDMMLNILTSYCLHSRRTMKNLLLKSVGHTMFLIHHHVLILNNWSTNVIAGGGGRKNILCFRNNFNFSWHHQVLLFL